VRHGDDQWADVVSWTLKALVSAEELGLTAENVKGIAEKGSKNPEVNRLLGKEPLQGLEAAGLEADWAVNVIAAVGNYGEIFERNLGEKTPLGINRGLNNLYTNGGLHYAPPVR
jgi:general L-amino acid transport system substrate-binding protein